MFFFKQGQEEPVECVVIGSRTLVAPSPYSPSVPAKAESVA